MTPTRSTGDPASLRRTHRGMALRQLLVAGGVSRTGLAERLGLSLMAASRITRDLMDAGLVEEAGVAARERGPGRHQTLLRIKSDGVFAAGIVLSAYSTEVAIVDAAGNLVERRQVRIDRTSDGAKAMVILASALNRLIDELAITRERITGVGIAVAAHLDPTRRHVLEAGYLGWAPFDLAKPVEKITGLPVYAENIVNALALAETTVGIARNMQNVIVVRAATILGATLVQHGQIVRGHGFKAGRIGHFHHVRTRIRCPCGRNDCLNCSASGWSILVRLGLIKASQYATEDVRIYASAIDQLTNSQRGESGANDRQVQAFSKAGAALANALHTIDLFVEPEAIVLDGSMARVSAYTSGIESRLRKLGGQGQQTLEKLRTGDIRAVRAAAISVLLDRIYSPSLDFEALCASSDVNARLNEMIGTE